MITLDESFFDVHTDFEQMWLPIDEAPEARECQMISSEKLMATIAWNSDEFHVIEVPPKGQKYNANYYSSSVLTKLLKITRQFRNNRQRKLILHADNAGPHAAKSIIEFCAKPDLRAAPHPPYSRTRHRPITFYLVTSRTN
jgi:hypothetical protein